MACTLAPRYTWQCVGEEAEAVGVGETDGLQGNQAQNGRRTASYLIVMSMKGELISVRPTRAGSRSCCVVVRWRYSTTAAVEQDYSSGM